MNDPIIDLTESINDVLHRCFYHHLHHGYVKEEDINEVMKEIHILFCDVIIAG